MFCFCFCLLGGIHDAGICPMGTLPISLRVHRAAGHVTRVSFVSHYFSHLYLFNHLILPSSNTSEQVVEY